MLTLKLVCSCVFLKTYAITSSGSESRLISRTMRTSLVDSSRTSTRCASFRSRTISPSLATSEDLLTV